MLLVVVVCIRVGLLIGVWVVGGVGMVVLSILFGCGDLEKGLELIVD